MENVTNYRILQNGTKLNNQYEIISLIGEGGFGVTYLAKDIYLQLNVAIKEYFPAQFASRNTMNGNNGISVISGHAEELYRRGLNDYTTEANRLAQFSNLRGIVSVLNFFYGNNTAYMVMEYIEGITLKQYMNEKGGILEWQEALDVLRPVIEDLSVVHKAGIIHRDISPDNIMVSPTGKMTIIDFGSARNYVDDEKSKTVMLKHGYAPPEQYYKNGNQGTWTDVYAMCATIYKMIAGIRLPESMALKGQTEKIKSLRDFAEDIPRHIEKAIYKGVEVDVENRIQTIDELKGYLYNGVEITLSAAQRKKKNRKIGLAISLVLAGLAIIFAIIFLLSMYDNNLKASEDSNNNNENDVELATPEFEVSKNEILPSMASDDINLIEEDNISLLPEEFKNLLIVDSNQMEYTDNNDSALITKIDSTLTDVEIPQMVNGLPITRIEGMGNNVTTVALPEGLISLGQYAFKNCVYLERVYIPSTLSSIEGGAFDNCRSLSEIVIANGNENYYVSDKALYNMDGTAIVSW